jgi:hypothetical protein
MAKADYRTKARECYRMGAMAPSPADQATWLKLASEWLAMSSGRGVPVLTGSTVVKREAAQTTTSDDLLVGLSPDCPWRDDPRRDRRPARLTAKRRTS